MQDWLKAGKVARQCLDYGASMIKKGVKLIDVCDKVEEKIYSMDAIPAFPAQISMNQTAAHYCPGPDDDTTFDDQVCCIDIGVCYNGAIGDNACTVDLSGKYGELVKASKEALKAASEKLRVGVTLGEIGKAIQTTIGDMGFSPIKNLSGHGLGPYDIHTKPSIPNYDTGDTTQLKKGMTIAIEPFATDGQGMIQETNNAEVFMLRAKKPVRNMITRNVLKEIDKFKGLPFTTRWLTRKIPAVKVNYALKDLVQLGIIDTFPPLTEVAKGMVSQAEDSFLIDDEVITLTRI
jgi:methionyl aminopeptidase